MQDPYEKHILAHDIKVGDIIETSDNGAIEVTRVQHEEYSDAPGEGSTYYWGRPVYKVMIEKEWKDTVILLNKEEVEKINERY